MSIRFERVMVKPSSATFTMRPVRRLLDRIVGDGTGWVDPTAGWNSPAQHTNDLNPDAPTTSHGDALDFLRSFPDRSVPGVLLDPPYSPRQVMECYKGVGRPVTKADTQSRFWRRLKDESARIIQPGGTAIVFGWNSVGLSPSRGFVMAEVHLFPAGGSHNDTIVTVEHRRDAALTFVEDGSS